MNNTRINLNADLGESFGAWSMGQDEAMLSIVSSANIACGFHAGDASVMRATVRAAKARGVSIGAHPSFPDLQGFGRRRMDIPPDELAALIVYQIGALQGIAASEEASVSHVKPHGALSNMACADIQLARVVAKAVKDTDPQLILLAPALSALAQAGLEAGLKVALEIYADRAYQDDGQLAPRSQLGAVMRDPAQCVQHVQAMIAAQALISQSGKQLPTAIHSICVHGDNPEAVQTAQAVRQELMRMGLELRPLTELV